MKMRDIIMEASVHRLPGPGETPFWLKPLAKLTKKNGLGNWNRGGCFAFANALASVFQGERWGICGFDGEEYPVHHAVAKIGTSFYDYSGLIENISRMTADYAKTTKARIYLKPASDPDVIWFEDEFLDDDDTEYLHRVLKRGLR